MAITSITPFNVSPTKSFNKRNQEQNAASVNFGSSSNIIVQKSVTKPIMAIGAALAAAAMITLAGCTGGSSPSGPEVTEPENPIIDTTETNSSSSSIDSIVVNSSSSKGDTTAVSSSSTASSSSAADTTKSSSSVASSSSAATSSSVASSSSSAVVSPEVIATVTTMNAILDAAGIGPNSKSGVLAKTAVASATTSVVAASITLTPSGALVPAGTLLQLNTSKLDGFTKEYVLSAANDDGTLTYTVKSTNVATGRVTEYQVYVINDNNSIIVTVTNDVNNSVKYVPTEAGIVKYDEGTGEIAYIITKTSGTPNGQTLTDPSDNGYANITASTVYQK